MVEKNVAAGSVRMLVVGSASTVTFWMAVIKLVTAGRLMIEVTVDTGKLSVEMIVEAGSVSVSTSSDKL